MLIIRNGKIITEEGILEGHILVVENDRIQSIEADSGNYLEGAQLIDGEGNYIMPGFIDIHSDMIEQLIQPRSTAIMDFGLALKEAEKQLALCGITTMYHSISMYREGTWDVKEIRKASQVKKLANFIKTIPAKAHLIRHRYHLRYEIDNLECYDDVVQMVDNNIVDLLSFMDHSPGQGQYKDISIYRKHLPEEGKNLADQEFVKIISQEQSKDMVSFEQLMALAKLAQERGVAIASHDDDTVEKLEINNKLKVNISEFPITIEVAQAAHEQGLSTVLGAPNVLLGGSHSGNLSAAEAINEGWGDILCSDYYPQSLLHAIFIMTEKHGQSLVEMVKLVSLNPAKAVGIAQEYGSMVVGKKADFVIVGKENDVPVIRSVYVDGQMVAKTNYRM